jgi:hypothetical protein
MATTWTIATLERTLADGSVTVAHWRVSEVDGDYSASAYGTCGFSPDPSSPDWVAYDDLTEAQCLQWCWDNGVDKDATEASLAAKIEADKNPVSAHGTPW